MQDECNTPWQVMLGSMNAVFCVFIMVGLWLELNLQSSPSPVASPYVFAFSEDVAIPSGGHKTKENPQTIFGKKVSA
jgi:hypothetical protein